MNTFPETDPCAYIPEMHLPDDGVVVDRGVAISGEIQSPALPKTRYIDVNILVLDDDPDMRDIVEAHLQIAAKALGIKVTVFRCDSADCAWEVWNNNVIHGVASDVYLGGPITGVEFIEAIKKRTKGGRVPTAVITGITDDYNMARLWNTGWVANKPLKPWFWKQCLWWLSHINSFWKGLAVEHPEYNNRITYSGINAIEEPK